MAVVVTGIVLLLAGRHLTFFFDEWSWILGRRGSGIGTLLDSYNGHFVLFPVAVYKLLFATVGLRHYWPYRMVGIALHLLCAVLVYVLVRRRVGPWLALVPSVLLLFMGTAFQDIMWPFQIGFLASVAGGLGALALIEDRRSDPFAAVLLVWSIASSAIGIPFLVAAFVALVVRRDPWSRLWIVGVPALVFLVWYLGWGGSENTSLNAVLGAPQYVASAAADTAAGVGGLDLSWGPALAIGVLVAVTLSWQRNVGGQPTAMLAAAVTGGLAFWVLTAIVRNEQPDPGASRYLYIGAVFMWLIAAEARVGSQLSRGWLALGALMAIGALLGNINALRDGERGLHEHDDNVRASLTAVEIAAPVVQPGFLPDKAEAPPITAGGYAAAVRDLGSPAYTVAQLERADFVLRERSDGVLAHAERLAAVPVSGSAICRPGVLPVSSSAIQVQASPGTAVVLRDGGGASAKVYLRRFASAFGPPRFAVLQPGSIVAIHFPADRAPAVPWHVLLVGSRAPTACVH